MIDYTAKELLLTTKDKIRELEDKLQKLSELTCIKNDKNIESVKYYSSGKSNSQKKPELYYSIKWNDKRLKGIINNLLIQINLYRWGCESGKILRDNNGMSYIDNSDYHLFIPKENQQAFKTISEEILSDEFIPNFLNETAYYSKDTTAIRKIDLYPSPISISCKETDRFIDFLFFPKDNKARFMIEKGQELNDEMLEELLNTKIDPSYYTESGIKSIASSPNREKEIIIPRFTDQSGTVDFDVLEDSKKLRLIKK